MAVRLEPSLDHQLLLWGTHQASGILHPASGTLGRPAKALIAVESETESFEEEEQDEGKGEKRQEVRLGDFHITTFQPITNTTLRIDFSLYGTVLVDNLDEFLELLGENEHRYRDQVGEIIRGSEVTDFTDSGLGLIKRKILEKTSRLLGKPLLLSVIFSDFSFVEQ